MEITRQKIRTRNGRTIPVRIIAPKFHGGITMIVCQELGRSITYYENFIRYLTDMGVRVINFDDTPNPIQDNPPDSQSLNEWATQGLDAIILFIRRQFPCDKLAFFAHGFSVQFIGLAPASLFLHHIIFFNGSMARRDRLSWKFLLKIWIKKIFTFLKTYPSGIRPAFLYPAGMLTTLFRWCLTNHGLFDQYPDHNYRKIKVPILALYTSKAQLKSINKLLAFFPSALITLKKTNKKEFFSIFQEWLAENKF